MTTKAMPAIKESPILFKGEMVRGILEGRKTKTRRVVKPQPEKWIDRYVESLDKNYWLPSGIFIKDSSGFLGRGPLEIRENSMPVKCPYGKVGDRLWVRETFAIESNWNIESELDYPPPFNGGRPIKRKTCPEYGSYWEQCHYRATDSEPELSYDDLEDSGCRWKPSIHMPRWASRINLEITDIRVERLQDISREDAKAEGFLPSIGNVLEYWNGRSYGNAELAFQACWTEINGKPRADGIDISWKANPYVWVVSFKVV